MVVSLERLSDNLKTFYSLIVVSEQNYEVAKEYDQHDYIIRFKMLAVEAALSGMCNIVDDCLKSLIDLGCSTAVEKFKNDGYFS